MKPGNKIRRFLKERHILNLKRVYHSIRLKMAWSAKKRTAYLKKHHLLNSIGENCSWGPGKLPVRCELIRLGNNVVIHQTASIVPHDMINGFLKRARPEMDFGYKERLGCIEIMDNVYVGNRAIILPDVRIGKNCIISTGSVVTRDIPENSVVAGNPGKVVGRFDIYCAMRRARKDEDGGLRNDRKQRERFIKETWERFEQKREEK